MVKVNIDIYGEKEGENALEVCGARLRMCNTYQFGSQLSAKTQKLASYSPK